MRELDFFRNTAKQRAAGAVKAVEAQTSAEVVIAVRRRSGDYRVVAYHFGMVLGALTTLVLLASPKVFTIAAIALDGIAAFIMGALVCAYVEELTRALTKPNTLQANVETAARAAFFDLGVSRTQGRNGILIFVSTFEHRVAVLADVGIDTAALGKGWTDTVEAIADAVKHTDFDAFLSSVEHLGPILGRVMPWTADDINELPDEVQ